MKLLNLWLLVVGSVIVTIGATCDLGLNGLWFGLSIPVTLYFYRREVEKEKIKKFKEDLSAYIAEELKNANHVKVFKK